MNRLVQVIIDAGKRGQTVTFKQGSSSDGTPQTLLIRVESGQDKNRLPLATIGQHWLSIDQLEAAIDDAGMVSDVVQAMSERVG